MPARPLRSTARGPLTIDGPWALEFGQAAANNGPTDTLFFTAGPADEENRLFGSITPATPQPTCRPEGRPIG